MEIELSPYKLHIIETISPPPLQPARQICMDEPIFYKQAVPNR